MSGKIRLWNDTGLKRRAKSLNTSRDVAWEEILIGLADTQKDNRVCSCIIGGS